MAASALWVVTESKNNNMTFQVMWVCVGLFVEQGILIKPSLKTDPK